MLEYTVDLIYELM